MAVGSGHLIAGAMEIRSWNEIMTFAFVTLSFGSSLASPEPRRYPSQTIFISVDISLHILHILALRTMGISNCISLFAGAVSASHYVRY